MTRQSKIDDWDAMTAAEHRFEQLPHEAQVREKLEQLRTFIRQLARSPQGQLELERRVQRLGFCQPIAGESAQNYYGRLRRWVDTDVDVKIGRV